MTENNAAQPGLTDDEIRDIITDAHQAYGAFKTGYGLALGRAIESALLTKLRAEGVQVADERCRRCGGPGWYTSHTTGYPESIPCSACNPQGVSVEQLENDPFMAAQLWRKPVDRAPVAGEATDADIRAVFLAHGFTVKEGQADLKPYVYEAARALLRAYAAPQASAMDFAEPYEGAREDLAIWKRRALAAESDLRAERGTSSRLVAAINAENGPTYMGDAAPQASEAARNADQDEMERLGWVNIGYKHDLEKARRAISFCNIPGFDTMSLDNAIYWLRAKADKEGGDCAKGAGDGDLHFIAGTIVQHLNGPLDPARVIAASRAIKDWINRQQLAALSPPRQSSSNP